MDQLSAVPYEIIEHIAFFLAVDGFLGPPCTLLPLLHLNRRIYSILSFNSNPHLYSRIFSAKFDTRSALAHFGSNSLSAIAFASELKRRCIYLKRIRDQLDCVNADTPFMITSTKVPEHLESVLWTAYLMMVENDGKNEAQLRNAKIHEWIRSYWFNTDGTSFVKAKLDADSWPENTNIAAAGMWLLWLFFRPDDYIKDRNTLIHVIKILKLFAFAAHRYSLTNMPWTVYSPTKPVMSSNTPLGLIAYGKKTALTPLPIGTPAILAYLSLYTRISTLHCKNPLCSSAIITSRDPEPLQIRDCAWQNSLVVPAPEVPLSTVFKPGSMDGVWEGMFTYAEYTVYAELLQGGPPSVLSRCLIAQHKQTWKIREHVLLSSTEDTPLPPGDPMLAFISHDATITETSDKTIIEQGATSTWYTRFTDLQDSSASSVRDIIITGEGHSAWGQFKILGRVRPYDGFVVLTKQYLDGDRYNWLYRGHVVGDNFVGRWRDPMSPIQLHGYEGCFVMSRRK